MPRTETILRAFIASPSDVSDERQRVKDVVAEVNVTVGIPNSIRIELITWENSSAPSIGADAQDVINRQLNDDYDIFIGIMWARFGSKTGRYESGSEEEFFRALDRFNSGGGVFDIMMYFKDGALSPSQIDPEQLIKVNAFKQRIGELGIYRWSFREPDEFERALRTHLAKKIIEFKNGGGPRPGLQVASSTTQQHDDDPGVLDLIEYIEEFTPELNETVIKLGSDTEWIVDRISIHTKEITQLATRTFGLPSRVDAIKLINASAQDLNEYARKTEEGAAKFGGLFEEMYKKIVDLLLMTKEMGGVDSHQYDTYRRQVLLLKDTLSGTMTQLEQFRSSVSTIPKMTSKLNSAKRRVSDALDGLLSQIGQAIRIFEEALQE